MRRFLVLLTAAAVAATPVVAEAAKKPVKKPTKRVVTWDYVGSYGLSGVGTLCAEPAVNCIDIPTEKHETKVSFSAVDTSGQKVALQYSFDGDYAGTVQDACSSGRFAVSKGTLVSFNTIYSPTCPGVTTSGTVTVTITGLK